MRIDNLYQLALMLACLALLAAWGVCELIRYVDRRRPLTRRERHYLHTVNSYKRAMREDQQ